MGSKNMNNYLELFESERYNILLRTRPKWFICNIKSNSKPSNTKESKSKPLNTKQSNNELVKKNLYNLKQNKTSYY